MLLSSSIFFVQLFRPRLQPTTQFHLEKKIKLKPANCRKISCKFIRKKNSESVRINDLECFFQASVRHIFPFVFPWHGCRFLYFVWLVQWFVHYKFCSRDFVIVGWFLDGKKYYRTVACWFTMVELHWRRWSITLGVWIEKGILNIFNCSLTLAILY